MRSVRSRTEHNEVIGVLRWMTARAAQKISILVKNTVKKRRRLLQESEREYSKYIEKEAFQ